MVTSAHVIFTKNAEADREFFRDILGFHSVDAGYGLAHFCFEVAFHPAEQNDTHTSGLHGYELDVGAANRDAIKS
jgi:catechol 2,3-dioxygenase-like lactoylglutathione lyase family enzyme